MIDQEVQQLTKLYDVLVEFFVNYSFQLVGAVIIFLIGLYLAKKCAQFVLSLCERKKIDTTLATFLSNFSKILIIVMVAIICLGKLGISVTPLVATIGAVSLGAGLAFQGLLTNYLAGMTIIVTRPFIVGNTITIQGITGQVKSIHLGVTFLVNEEEELITIPNKYIVGEVLFNSYDNKLVETSIGVAYDTEIANAIDIVLNAVNSIKEVSQERPPQVGIDEFADSSINIGVRFWGPTKHIASLRYQVNFAIHQALTEAGVVIPFPQREIRLLNRADEPTTANLD